MTSTEQATIAVIGGSGLYQMPGLTDVTKVSVSTPFGDPSGDIMIGTLSGKRVAFLARHGAGHVYTPTQVPYRANIYALKKLGVRFIISVSACGSLQEAVAPGHFVIPDGLYDNTKDRDRSFFERGIVGHVGVADPFCSVLSDQLYDAVKATGGTVHKGGTFITIEGPRFSTKAESEIFRSWGCRIIGMTTSPEAFLAREAEISYGVIAHVTDYDVWHEEEEPVSVDVVVKRVNENIDTIRKAIAGLLETIDDTVETDAHNALAGALMTNPDHIPADELEKLSLIVGCYYS